MGDDIIKHFCRRMAPYAPPEELRRIEIELRRQWGGAEVYIKKSPAEGKVRALAGRLAAGATIREAFEAAGVAKSQGYFYLRTRNR
jgi:hypothetical protein